MQTIAKKTEAMAKSAGALEAPSPKTIQNLIKSMQPEIEKALPSCIDLERFTRIALTAINSNPRLGSCEGKTLLAAIMLAAQLGLEVNSPLGEAYLIPYGNKCQFQLGYKGYLTLAYRSGEIITVSAYTVYSNDTFEYELGLKPILRHVPAKTNRGDPVYYYAIYRTRLGGYGYEVMSIEDIKKHRDKFSKASKSKSGEASSSPWDTCFDEMAKKTVLMRCLKYAPMSADYKQAARTDGCIKRDIEVDMFAAPSETITAVFMDDENAQQSTTDTVQVNE